MAIVPSTDYAGQIDTDAQYPQGKAKNVTIQGDGTGTPLEKAWVNDIWGFLQQLLAQAGITPSGNPDEVGTSDYWDALVDLIPVRYVGKVTTVATTPTIVTAFGIAPAPSYAGYAINLTWASALVGTETSAVVLTTMENSGDIFSNGRALSTTVAQIYGQDVTTGSLDLDGASSGALEIGVVVLGTAP